MESGNHIYRPSDLNRWVIRFFVGLGFLLGLFMVTYPIILSIPLTDTKDYTILCVIGLIIAALCAFVLFTKDKYQVETTPHSIRISGTFTVEEYLKSDIEGYRTFVYRNNKSFYFYLKNSQKRVAVQLNMDQNRELLKWFKENFTDLDEATRERELKEVHDDERLGSTPEERMALLAQAKLAAQILNGVGFVLGFWFLLAPKPYYLVCALMLIFPLLPILMPLFFRGAAKFALIYQNKSVYATTVQIFLLPLFFLVISAFKQWHVVNLAPFWLPFGLLTTFLLVLLLVCSMNHQKDRTTYFVAFCICAAYSMSLVLYINGLLDNSKPAVFTSQIVNKYVTRGRSTSYNLTFGAFGPVTDTTSVQVNQNFYNRHNIGDPMEMFLRDGFLKIPWFSFSEEGPTVPGHSELHKAYQYYKDRDYVESLEWFKKSAAVGNADAEDFIGDQYEFGSGVSKNYLEALKWYRLAAAQGNAHAEGSLGFFYMKGWAVNQDYNEAFKWFQKAANQNYITGIRNLGIMYAAGQGVKQDYAQAISWFKKGVDVGDAPCEIGLGDLYADGHGMPQNFVEALNLYQKALLQGSPDAQVRIDITQKRMAKKK